MGRDRAAYMRAYRAQKRTHDAVREKVGDILYDKVQIQAERIRELEAEVVRLKRELASRPEPVAAHTFSSRPFQPVPKRPAK